jgi:hypothetical protein
MPLEPVARHGLFFDLYVETQLAPTLGPGDVIILGNVQPQKPKGRRHSARHRGLVPAVAAL